MCHNKEFPEDPGLKGEMVLQIEREEQNQKYLVGQQLALWAKKKWRLSSPQMG